MRSEKDSPKRPRLFKRNKHILEVIPCIVLDLYTLYRSFILSISLKKIFILVYFMPNIDKIGNYKESDVMLIGAIVVGFAKLVSRIVNKPAENSL